MAAKGFKLIEALQLHFKLERWGAGCLRDWHEQTRFQGASTGRLNLALNVADGLRRFTGDTAHEKRTTYMRTCSVRMAVLFGAASLYLFETERGLQLVHLKFNPQR